jgi:hypothetical protein
MIAIPTEMDYRYGMGKHIIRIPRRNRREALRPSSKPQTSTRGETSTFSQTLFALVLPIALQNLLSTLGSSATVIMLGSVSQTALSAVSLANQILFILNLVLLWNKCVSRRWGLCQF